jgi:hypothetical protein
MVTTELRQVTVGSKNSYLKAICGGFHKMLRYLQIAYAIISFSKMTKFRGVTHQNKTDAQITFVIFSQHLSRKSSHCEYFSQGQTACNHRTMIIAKFSSGRHQ